ncbi:hypothetical protein AOLI_G00179640 [Acnodon oligacanthus]
MAELKRVYRGDVSPLLQTEELTTGATRAAYSASTHDSGLAGEGRCGCRGLDPSMPAVSLLKMYFLLGSALGVLLALYGLVDSVGGLMFVPTRHHMEVEWAVKDAPAAAPGRNTAKKHIGQR